MFVQHIVQAYNRENTKRPHCWRGDPLVVEFSHNEPVMRKAFPGHMTLSCILQMGYIDHWKRQRDSQLISPGQNGCHFADDIFKCIIFSENLWISIKISLKYVPKAPINNIPALV